MIKAKKKQELRKTKVLRKFASLDAYDHFSERDEVDELEQKRILKSVWKDSVV